MEIYKRLVERLKTEPNYTDDEGKLKKWVVLQKAQDADAELIALLLGDEELRKAFFREAADALVFDQRKLSLFLEQKCFLEDSYTQYSKKIGIAVGGQYLSQHTGVELVWPYKDCMLEGGQTKEEQQRNEIFFNQTLAQDEITQLKEPKVLTGGRKYTADDCTSDFTLRRNDKGVIADNLIIKGNNLLALYTLERQFGGRIGLVYIDPPYYFRKTKPSDAFGYNSNFKLSSWLCFMRDRLEVAKRLLKPNGVILCHIAEDGVHWLKVLMEEVFGVDNFVETFIWRNTDNAPSLSPKSRSSVEYILCFEKNRDSERKYIGKDTENDDTPLLNSGNAVHELIFRKGKIHFSIPDGIYRGGGRKAA